MTPEEEYLIANSDVIEALAAAAIELRDLLRQTKRKCGKTVWQMLAEINAECRRECLQQRPTQGRFSR